MILALSLAASVVTGPDAAPALDAVKRCDTEAMQAITKAEPHRRSEWAAALYAEQQAIARERLELAARAALQPALPDDLEAQAALDARQRQLDVAKGVENGWRSLLEELRLDFLANCGASSRRRT